MPSHLLLGLDIGTASVKAVLAERVKDRPVIRFVHEEPSSGLRRGAIIDLPEASSAVARTVGAVRKFAKTGARTVYVNIGTSQVRAQLSRGMVAVSRADSEIYEDDVERALKSSQTVGVAPNRMLIHTVTREFMLDGVGDIQDPVGLSGSRLEVQSIVVDAFAPHVKNILRIVELTSGRVAGLVLSPLAAARAIVSRKQRELGTALLDIGAGTTGVAVYEERKLLGTAVLPVGAAHITNDIALGLKIPVSAAEEVKRREGYAYAHDVGGKEAIDLAQYAPEASGAISRRFVSEIIEARLAELLELVNNELKSIGKAGVLAGGAVVVGGGAKMPGLPALVKRELKVSCQVGCALRDEWGGDLGDFVETFEDPAFAVPLGLILWGAEKERWFGERSHSWIRMFHPKHLFRYFVP